MAPPEFTEEVGCWVIVRGHKITLRGGYWKRWRNTPWPATSETQPPIPPMPTRIPEIALEEQNGVDPRDHDGYFQSANGSFIFAGHSV